MLGPISQRHPRQAKSKKYIISAARPALLMITLDLSSEKDLELSSDPQTVDH
jgi:hypothetical protein